MKLKWNKIRGIQIDDTETYVIERWNGSCLLLVQVDNKNGHKEYRTIYSSYYMNEVKNFANRHYTANFKIKACKEKNHNYEFFTCPCCKKRLYSSSLVYVRNGIIAGCERNEKLEDNFIPTTLEEYLRSI